MQRTFNTFNNKLFTSQPWLDAFLLRESKKGQQVKQISLNSQFAVNTREALKTRVVFMREERGRNQEERQKIQKVHNELDALPLLPNFSFA